MHAQDLSPVLGLTTWTWCRQFRCMQGHLVSQLSLCNALWEVYVTHGLFQAGFGCVHVCQAGFGCVHVWQACNGVDHQQETFLSRLVNLLFPGAVLDIDRHNSSTKHTGLAASLGSACSTARSFKGCKCIPALHIQEHHTGRLSCNATDHICSGHL